MAVDMHEHKFILRLEELPRFEKGEEADKQVNDIDFPAWRALFTGLLLWGHSTGYRLPSYERFFDYCRKAYTLGEGAKRFGRWFEEPLIEKTERRVKAWYESGMAETYLYVCLVDAFEDVLKDGVVLYDPRTDWKMKWDAAVITRGERFAVNSFWGSPGGRKNVEVRREAVERERKARTSVSSHWENAERERWTELRVFRSEEECQVVNGVRLFSISSVNQLLAAMYERAGYAEDERFFFPQDKSGRRRVYRELLRRRTNLPEEAR